MMKNIILFICLSLFIFGLHRSYAEEVVEEVATSQKEVIKEKQSWQAENDTALKFSPFTTSIFANGESEQMSGFSMGVKLPWTKRVSVIPQYIILLDGASDDKSSNTSKGMGARMDVNYDTYLEKNWGVNLGVSGYLIQQENSTRSAGLEGFAGPYYKTDFFRIGLDMRYGQGSFFSMNDGFKQLNMNSESNSGFHTLTFMAHVSLLL